LSGSINCDISGFSASMGHIGKHVTGGQAAASGADPEVELFLFTDFKKIYPACLDAQSAEIIDDKLEFA